MPGGGGVGGSVAPMCCRSCLGCRPAKKLRGEDRAEALPIFSLARRTAHAGGWGGAGPPSVAGGGGCRVAEKFRVDDREEALLIFYWALNIYSSQFYANLPSLPTPPYPALSAPRPLFGLVPSPASEQNFVRLGCVDITSRQGPFLQGTVKN